MSRNPTMQELNAAYQKARIETQEAQVRQRMAEERLLSAVVNAGWVHCLKLNPRALAFQVRHLPESDGPSRAIPV